VERPVDQHIARKGPRGRKADVCFWQTQTGQSAGGPDGESNCLQNSKTRSVACQMTSSATGATRPMEYSTTVDLVTRTGAPTDAT
jgi:hypothetical protein